MSATHTFTFTRTHTATFAADAMRNVLRTVIRELGLDPGKLIDDWVVTGRAAKIWLETGHLELVTLEFYVPGSSDACSRVDLPVAYDGSGVDDDMWVDREHIRRSIAKIGKLPANCSYRVVMSAPDGRDVEGMVDTDFLSVSGLTTRSAGSVISTPDIVAGLRWWS